MRTPEPLRNAMRVTRRRPGFVALLVVILGIGIGATTAALNVAASVLLNPLPVRDESRLLLIAKTLPAGTTLVPFSYAEIFAWREASRTLASIAGVQYDGAWPWPAEFGEMAMTVTGTMVSGNFFTVLESEPTVGRLLAEEDGLAGAEEVAVIGYGLWRRRFGGDGGVVGQRIRLNGRPATIVGVAPPGFEFPKGVDVWQPLRAAPDVVNEGWFSLVARLEPGMTMTQASEEAAALLNRLESFARPGLPPNVRTEVVPLKDAIVGDVRPVIVLFVAAAILVFVVSCINAVILLLVRGAARAREISLCFALGATRWRLVRAAMAETAMFVAAGGLIGAVVAFWLQRALIAAAPAGVPRLDQIAFDGRTLSVVAVITLLAAVLAGGLSALWTVRHRPVARWRDPSGHVTTGGGGQVRRQLILAVQLAFALLVTVAAALLVRSLQELQAAHLGFSPERLSVVQVPLVGSAYEDPERRQQLFDRLVVRMEALPGVVAVTPVLLRPFTGRDGWDASFTREGQGRDETAANPGLHLEAVAPNYFATMGIPVRGGRAFADSDRAGALPVAIVSEALARHAWPGSPALGERLKFGVPDSPTPWMTVVGVVGDVRYRDLASPPPAIYVPIRQTQFPARFLVVRAAIDDAPVLSMAQRTLAEIDPAEPVVEASAIAELLGGELAAPRFYMWALVLFAGAAVLLGGVGVFGVLGAFVALRSREVGLRMALGATPADIRALALWQVTWPAASGVAAGTLAALAAMPLLQPLLFNVTPLDATAYVAGWMVLLLASLFGSLLPVNRASRLDPARLLRSE